KSGQWEILFDGKHTDKWVAVGGSGNSFPDDVWEVDNGMLSIKEDKRGKSIMTKETFDDFELVFDFKLAYAANSGIKYLVNKIKNNKTGKIGWNGPEYQIIDDYNNKYVKNNKHDIGSTASLYLIYAPENKTLYPSGQWNHGRIIVKGRHIEHWLNGVKVVSCERGSKDFRERVSKTKFKDYTHYGEIQGGHIMLTNHGDKVYYRDIKIKRIK